MNTSKAIKYLFSKGFMLFLAVLIVATIAPQILNTKSALADDGGYPWAGALCAWTNLATGACSGYDWGLTTCPSGDGYCTSGNQINGSYQLNNWAYGFPNSPSYPPCKL